LPNNSADLVFVIEDGQAKIKNQIIHTGEIIGFIDIVTESNYLNKVVAKKQLSTNLFQSRAIKKYDLQKISFPLVLINRFILCCFR